MPSDLSAQTVGALLTGLTSLVVAVGAILSNRTKRVAADVDELRRDVEVLQGQVRDAIRHIYTLEVKMAEVGIDAPPRPPSLRLVGRDPAA